jgi:hypothetical protein
MICCRAGSPNAKNTSVASLSVRSIVEMETGMKALGSTLVTRRRARGPCGVGGLIE